MIGLVAEVAPLLRAFGGGPQATPPVLTVVDHGDGSGATATISGSAIGSLNVVYVQTFDGQITTPHWVVADTRTGDGPLTLSLPNGHYFAFLASESSGLAVHSSIAYFAVSEAAASVYHRCLSAAQARIRLLLLSEMPVENVVIHKVPLNRSPSGGPLLPAIVLSPRRAAMPKDDGNNNFDDVHYDVLVAIFDRDNQEPSLALLLDRHLLWREQIARAFRNQRLTGVSEVINAEVEPAEGLLDEGWRNELAVSALLVRFISRETRGLN